MNWHTFDFPEYSVNGIDNTPVKRDFVKIPENLEGLSVLDIGAWDGYFSFLCEKRGAKRVLAFDSPKHSWNKEKVFVSGAEIVQDGKANFNEVRELLKSKVEDREGELDELENFGETFDVVLDLGILYHVLDPYKHIRDLYKVTNKLLILETHIDVNDAPMPVMRFYAHSEVNNDDGTFWGPNMLCVYEMLSKVGFKNIKADYKNGRGIFHAEK
jgi:tRNA (mo5U34)-methyltransferase